ncbi:MAG: helix-turn-helix domain-containing protein [Bacteroidales bacterium]
MACFFYIHAHRSISGEYDTFRYILDIPGILVSVLIIPLLFLYLRTVAGEKYRLSLLYATISPGIALAFIISVLHLTIGYDDIMQYMHNGMKYPEEKRRVMEIYILLRTKIYTGLLIVQCFTLACAASELLYRNLRKSSFRSKSNDDYTYRICIITGGISILSIMSVVLFIIRRGQADYSLTYPAISYSIISVLINIIYYNAIRIREYIQPGSTDFNRILKDPEQIAYNPETLLPVSRNRNLQIMFEEKVLRDELYLKQNLRIDDVALLLNSNRTYVSAMINEFYNTNFSNCINRIRIEHAKKILIESPDIKQDQIALMCGFQNASSFNRVFKQIEAVPPRTWLRNHHNPCHTDTLIRRG